MIFIVASRSFSITSFTSRQLLFCSSSVFLLGIEQMHVELHIFFVLFENG